MKFFHPESKENLILTLKHNLANRQLKESEFYTLTQRLETRGYREACEGEPFFTDEELKHKFDELMEKHKDNTILESIEDLCEWCYEKGRTKYLSKCGAV